MPPLASPIGRHRLADGAAQSFYARGKLSLAAEAFGEGLVNTRIAVAMRSARRIGSYQALLKTTSFSFAELGNSTLDGQRMVHPFTDPNTL